MSEDQVTHTPTPWTCSGEDDGDFMLWGAPDDAFIGNVGASPMVRVGDKIAFDIDKANAEFIVLAVNSHDALTARVAELEAENERLRSEPNSIRQEVIAAWEALPGGYHDLGRVQMWMMDDLYPVIQKFRAALKPGA